MIPLKFLPAVVASLALHSAASAYTDWQNDYTGTESGTLLLWKFDQPTPNLDSSGNAHSVSLGSNATVGQSDGKFGQAYYSETRSSANDSYAAATGSVSTFSPSAISVEFWFKPEADGITTASLSYFFDKKFTANTGVYLRLNNTGDLAGTLDFSVGNGTSSHNLRTQALSWDSSLWYHIAVTYENIDGDGKMVIFRDGNELASIIVDDFGNLQNSGTLWRLGNRLGSTYGSVPGSYDNFRISNVAYAYAPIPEPATAALILPVSIAGAMLMRKQRRNKN